MRTDFTYTFGADLTRDCDILHHPDSTWQDLVTMEDTDGVDISPLVARATQTHNELSLTLNWHDELYCPAQPKPGELISVRFGTQRLWHGAIESINDYREERGTRTMNLTARSRDASPLWREMRWSTKVYPAGTDLGAIGVDVLRALGLTADEYMLPPTGKTTPHSGLQIADLPAWQMLEPLLLAIGQSPWVDAVGRFKGISRDTSGRTPDLVLDQEQVLQIRGSRSRPPVSAVLLKWLDKNLTKSSQQDQVLGRESITAGFFKLTQEREIYWSSDRKQRAENTYMKVLQSVNSGLLPVGDEEYQQITEFMGRITVTTSLWVPLLATASLAGLLAAHQIPDGVAFGETIPVGRIVEGISEGVILLIMMSLGVGHYEIWGQPFDYVHAVNTTEAYNTAAPQWQRSEQVIENDFINDEAHAQGVAARELLYANLSARSWGVDIVDDPRVEVGDILELPDSSRIYVTGYTRDLTRGADAVLKIDGFRV